MHIENAVRLLYRPYVLERSQGHKHSEQFEDLGLVTEIRKKSPINELRWNILNPIEQ